MEKITSLFLIALIAMGGLFTLVRTEWDASQRQPFVDGVTQAQIQDQITGSFPLRELSISLWRAFEFQAFGEGTRAVIVGKDGWLFSAEEFEAHSEQGTVLKDRVALTAQIVDQLQTQDITVVVALLPDKARIVNARLPAGRSNFLQSRYQTARLGLLANGVNVPDLSTALSAAQTQENVFFKSDTHWTPFGANFAAQTLASHVHAPGIATIAFEAAHADQPTTFTGDLAKFVSTPPLRRLTGPREETLNQQTAVSDQGIASLLGDAPEPEGRLIGTSFSAIERWGFLDALKVAYQSDFLNLAQEGAGPFEPMHEFLRELENGAKLPSIVVWELPERYLTITPEGGR
ncbi:alginate O-acetyltransferase AlgX-related protein [Cognatishimia activa]|uniref:alginate O-acetyltransferase AlgX-related protein n=1 Tax=Cognatishimia activa TaxID=1715691 RepID=UPI0013F4E6FD|nr:hypothetical protein [Cognatishimia activa]